MEQKAKSAPKSLFIGIPVGFLYGNEYIREAELLKTNGTAEKVFTEKFPEKPYTWMGYVVSVGTKSIGGIPTGSSAREEHEKSGSITIPHVVLSMPLADVNSTLVEIHRRVWEGSIPEQEVLCKYCTRKNIVDINLDKICLKESDQQLVDNGYEWHDLNITLEDGWTFKSPTILHTNNKAYEELDGVTFTKFVFRVPTLQDAIRNEKFSNNTVDFWRRIAFDCCTSIEAVDEKGVTIHELPREAINLAGMKIFNQYLLGQDLKSIRTLLRDTLPTLPFNYVDTCFCEMKREIPVTMEATNFFSE